MRKNGGIFQKWFSNFTLAVFTQSLHAVMLVFLLRLLAALYDSSYTVVDGIETLNEDKKPPEVLMSVITFFCVTGITRTEKIVKSMFGIGESEFLKDTRENSAKTFHAIRSAGNIAKNATSAASAGIKGAKTKARMKADMDKLVKEGKAKKVGGIGKNHRFGYYVAGDFGKQDSPTDTPKSAPSNSAAGLTEDSSARLAELKNKYNEKMAESDAKMEQSKHYRAESQKKVSRNDYKSDDQYLNNVSQENTKRRNAAAAADKLSDESKQAYLEAMEFEKQIHEIEKQQKNQSTSRPSTSSASNSNPGATPTATNATGSRLKSDIPVDDGSSVGGSMDSPSSGSNGGSSSGGSKEMSEYEKLRLEDLKESRQEKFQKKIDDYNKANRDVRKALGDSIVNIGATAAGLGFGAGMDNDLSDIINIGNAISDPIVKKSTDMFIAQQNKKIQKAIYSTTAEHGGAEAVMKVKISPEFVNDPTLYSTVVGGIEKMVRNASKQAASKTSSVTVDHNVDVNANVSANVNANANVTQQVNQAVNQQVNQAVTQNVKQNVVQKVSKAVVKNVKENAHATLKSMKNDAKGWTFKSNVDRENYINNVDDI